MGKSEVRRDISRVVWVSVKEQSAVEMLFDRKSARWMGFDADVLDGNAVLCPDD